VRAGAVLGGGTSEQVEPLPVMGKNLDLSFKLPMIYWIVEGESGEMGKPTGMDAVRQKATYPGVLGVTGAKDQAHRLGRAALLELQSFTAAAEPLRQLAQYLLIRRQ